MKLSSFVLDLGLSRNPSASDPPTLTRNRGRRSQYPSTNPSLSIKARTCVSCDKVSSTLVPAAHTVYAAATVLDQGLPAPSVAISGRWCCTCAFCTKTAQNPVATACSKVIHRCVVRHSSNSMEISTKEQSLPDRPTDERISAAGRPWARSRTKLGARETARVRPY